MRRSTHGGTRRHGGGFTLIELLVVISIIMLLAALALPVLMKAAAQARGAQCVSNVRQLATAFRTYATVHDGVLPGSEGPVQPRSATWLYPKHPWNEGDLTSMWPEMPTKGQLYPYFHDPDLILCPSDREGNGKLSYSMPQQCANKMMDQAWNTTVSILLMDEHILYNIGGLSSLARREGGFGCSDRPGARHNGRTAVAFFDAHSELIRFDPGLQAIDFYVDPWGKACGWWRELWPYTCYQGEKRPVGKIW